MCMSMCICVLIMCDRALSFDFEKKKKKYLCLIRAIHYHYCCYMCIKTGQASTCVPKTGQYIHTKVRLASTCAPRQDWLISVHNVLLLFLLLNQRVCQSYQRSAFPRVYQRHCVRLESSFLTFVITIAGFYLVLVSAFGLNNVYFLYNNSLTI